MSLTRIPVGRVVAALVVVAGAASCTKSSGGPDGWVEVGSEATIRAEGVMYLPELRAFVVAMDDSIVALTDGTQHLDGERVLYCAARGGFVGPHGESFDRQGRYLAGPAASDMDLVTIRIEGDVVSIQPGEITLTPGRSAGMVPSPGARCDGSEDPAGFVRTG